MLTSQPLLKGPKLKQMLQIKHQLHVYFKVSMDIELGLSSYMVILLVNECYGSMPNSQRPERLMVVIIWFKS